jgi:GNAT superfamily N-acetyltransferase
VRNFRSYPTIKRSKVIRLGPETFSVTFRYWYNNFICPGILTIRVIDSVAHVSNVHVDLKFRRQGIATELYNAADKYLLNKHLPILSPSDNLTKDGKKFWDSRG